MHQFMLSRRNFVQLSAAATAASMLPASQAKAATPAFTYYWEQTPAVHQAKYNELGWLGYRPVSISLLNGAVDPRVTAVWIQRAGPAWEMSVVMPLGDVSIVADWWAAFGYRVTQLTAAGSISDPRFIMVVEQGALNGTLVLPALRNVAAGATPTDTTIEYWVKQAFDTGKIPVSIAQYGALSDPRYALVIANNTNKVCWNLDGRNEETIPLSRRNSAQELQRGRNALVAMTTQGRYMTLYRNDELIYPTRFRHDLTVNNIDADIAAQKAQDYYPIQLALGGTGASRRFGVTYVKSETVVPRQIYKTGANRAAFIDDLLIAGMNSNKVRSASLAVVRNKRLIYARAFTLAEVGYKQVSPTSHFRLASVSKTLTTMLALQMIQAGVPGFTLATRLHDILNFRTPSLGAPALGWAFITVGDVLRHRSGLGDAPRIKEVAAALGVNTPITRDQMASYCCQFPVQFMPGAGPTGPAATRPLYSNLAFILLGMAIDKLLPETFEQALRARVLTPLGATRMRVSPALIENHPADEAPYDSQFLDVNTSVVTGDGRIVPMVYGADVDYSVWEAAGGLSMAAPDLAKVLTSLCVPNALLNANSIRMMLEPRRNYDAAFSTDYTRMGFDNGWARVPEVPNGYKGGNFLGTSTIIHVVPNDVSFVLLFNRNDPTGDYYPDFQSLRQAILNPSNPVIPDNPDLFPTFGMPSF